jgi:F0F1-type ATP synthase assembly protein I
MGFINDAVGGFYGLLGGACRFIPYCELVLLGFKVVMLLFLVGWVRSHLGGGLVATIVMLVLGYLVLFVYFDIFGPLTLVYLLLIMGVTGIIQDLAFGGGHYFGPSEAEHAMAAGQAGILKKIQRGEA